MIGVIQKILFSEQWGGDYFVDRALLLSELLENEEANTELIATLTDFHSASMDTFEYMRTRDPGVKRLVIVLKRSEPQWGYRYFHNMSEEDWAHVRAYPSKQQMEDLRPILFPMLGWQHLGYLQVDSLPEDVTFNDGLPVLSIDQAESIWSANKDRFI